jgi:uncharacterized protein (TIGR00369 family)
MPTLNPDWIQFIKPFINKSAFFKHENMKLVDLKYGEAFLELDIEKKHLQGYGMVQGGVYGAIIDAAGWWAVFTQVKGNFNAFTAEMKLNYLASANSGKFITHGKCIKLGKTLGLGEARIKNEEGKLLAHGTVTVIIGPPFEYPGSINVPPKHLSE